MDGALEIARSYRRWLSIIPQTALWAEWGSQFLLETAFVPSWFAGSSWFRLGFRCLSPFLSLLSFLRKGVLFHHDLLGCPGSGWGSGACLPFSLLFLSSGKGVCSIMICWFLLVPAGVPVLVSLLLPSLVPVLVSLLLSSFFPQDRGSVASWFAGSSWFRLGFRCLSPFYCLLSFLRKGVLLHHDLLVPLGSGWGSGACPHASLFFLSSGKRFCSIMICWFLPGPAGVPVLVSLLLSSLVPVLVSLPLSSYLFFLSSGQGFCSIMICWFLLVPAGVPVLVSPSSLFFLSSGKGFCFIMICWFLLVPAGVPVLVSLLLSSMVPVLLSLLLSSFFPQERGSVPSWFAGSSGSGWGSGACLPSSLFFLSSGKGFCSIMICWFLLVPAGVPVLVSPSSLFFGSGACLPASLFFLSSGKGVCSIMICWFLLVPVWVLVLVNLLLSSLVPVLVSLLLSSFFPQERGSVPSWFASSSWFRLGFRCLSPLHLSSFFPQERGSVSSWFAGSSWFWLGFRCLSPCFSLLSFLRKGVLFHHDLLVPLGSGWGSGACPHASLFFLSLGKGFCSIMICWFFRVRLGFRCLSPFFSLLWFRCLSAIFSLLISSFFPQDRGSVPSLFAGSSWFWLGFRCLCSYSLFFGSGACLPSSLFFGSGACLPSSLFLVLFHHDLLVPLGSGWGSGTCLPFFSLLRFRCLSPCFSLLSFLRKGVLFHHDLLVPPGSGTCLPSSLFFGSGACLPASLFFLSSGKGFCSIMICWFLLVPAGVPVLVSLLLSSFFSQERGSVSSWISWFLLLWAGVPVLVSLLLDFWRLGVNVSPLPIWLLLTPSMRCIEMDGHGCSQILSFSWILLHFQTLSNRQPDGSLHILIDLFHAQLCLFSRKSHGLVLTLLFSRENSLYQFWTRLKIKDLHSEWIPECVGASLLLPRICTVEVMKE